MKTIIINLAALVMVFVSGLAVNNIINNEEVETVNVEQVEQYVAANDKADKVEQTQDTYIINEVNGTEYYGVTPDNDDDLTGVYFTDEDIINGDVIDEGNKVTATFEGEELISIEKAGYDKYVMAEDGSYVIESFYNNSVNDTNVNVVNDEVSDESDGEEMIMAEDGSMVPVSFYE